MVTRIAEIIENKGIKAEVQEVTKGNATMLGITMGEGTIRPCLYPEQFAEYDIEQIANKLISKYEECKDYKPSIDVSDLIDLEVITDKILPCVRPVAHNTDEVTVELFDFEMYFRVAIDATSEGLSTYTIKNEHIKAMGISVEELTAIAIENAGKYTTVQSMFDTLMSFKKDMDFDDMLNNLDEDMPMYVVTNNFKSFGGANAFLCKSQLQKLADKLADDLYILPSSIHETIVIKAEGAEVDFLKSMVADVNATQVVPSERLSNQVYKYNRSTDEITIA